MRHEEQLPQRRATTCSCNLPDHLCGDPPLVVALRVQAHLSSVHGRREAIQLLPDEGTKKEDTMFSNVPTCPEGTDLPCCSRPGLTTVISSVDAGAS